MARSAEEEKELDELEVSSAPPGSEGLTVEANSPLHPTEYSGAVSMAMLNMFPTMDLEVADGRMTGRATGSAAVARLRRRIREMRIRDTARSIFRGGSADDSFTFALNKQSAYAKIPNFSTGGAPLGDIDVTVTAEDIEAVLEWLCQLDDE
jgi:predicted RNA binding protein with dsRBD fold (UPF0201 family)